jgi:hypothetical protein
MTEPNRPPAIDDAEIEARFRAAGVVVPADRAEGAYGAARRLLSSLHWLRTARGAAAEPAHVFSLEDKSR